MVLIRKKTLKPRKTPVQARSNVTLEAIFDAAVQVLLKTGVKHITTTRVADRAGVSVGTLYQYHPNIQSLMAAVLERHLQQVAGETMAACEKHHGRPLDVMIDAMVDGLIAAKMARADVSRALYAVHSNLNCADIVRRYVEQSERAMQAMLETASDYKVSDAATASTVLISAQTGLVRAILEPGTTPQRVQELRDHLVLLCRGYLKQVAVRRTK